MGRVADSLRELGVADDTLVIFTSDNGPVWFDADVKRYGHRTTHMLRGMKADAYEGGHRMPLIARWPGVIKPGSVSGATICFTDMLATFAAIVGHELPADAGEDSYNVLPAMTNPEPGLSIREATVVDRSIRAGDWKLIFGPGQGGLSRKYGGQPIRDPKPKGELYNLREDLSETRDLYREHPEVVERLTRLIDEYKKRGRSTPTPRK